MGWSLYNDNQIKPCETVSIYRFIFTACYNQVPIPLNSFTKKYESLGNQTTKNPRRNPTISRSPLLTSL
ncbi:hypothetical protein PLAN_120311 [Planktothrix rubescens CCAP 1459/22]|uniref:Uncharacterized protein n=1 Tax=Planktothrix rubescens CCAP 1459/22 TaxID=329571 RepID=A0A6J7ZH68_PLARU|nr:hypothetical protein PLAN_120311 [Planktothrix rubescens NIVA-CYA 18]